MFKIKYLYQVSAIFGVFTLSASIAGASSCPNLTSSQLKEIANNESLKLGDGEAVRPFDKKSSENLAKALGNIPETTFKPQNPTKGSVKLTGRLGMCAYKVNPNQTEEIRLDVVKCPDPMLILKELHSGRANDRKKPLLPGWLFVPNVVPFNFLTDISGPEAMGIPGEYGGPQAKLVRINSRDMTCLYEFTEGAVPTRNAQGEHDGMGVPIRGEKFAVRALIMLPN